MKLGRIAFGPKRERPDAAAAMSAMVRAGYNAVTQMHDLRALAKEAADALEWCLSTLGEMGVDYMPGDMVLEKLRASVVSQTDAGGEG